MSKRRRRPEEDAELENALAALHGDTHPIIKLRQQPLIAQMLETTRTHASFQIDVDALMAEIREMHKMTAYDLKAFDVDKSDAGFSSATDALQVLKGNQDRLVAIAHDLRVVQRKAERTFAAGDAWLRHQEDIQSLTATESTKIIALILEPISDLLANIKMLLKVITDALAHLDKNSAHMASWNSMYKQYVFATGSRRHGNEEEDTSLRPQRRRLGGR